MLRKNTHIAWLLMTIGTVALLPEAFAAEYSTKAVEESVAQQSHVQIYVVPEYYRLTSEGLTLSGPDLGFGAEYALNESWAGGIEVKHAYSTSGFSGLFLGTIFKGRYAVTGSFVSRRKDIRVKGWPMVENSEAQEGGIRAEIFLANYSVFSSQSEVPFSGFGIAGTYEFAMGKKYTAEPGMAFDQTSNLRQSLQSVRFFLRLKMPI